VLFILLIPDKFVEACLYGIAWIYTYLSPLFVHGEFWSLSQWHMIVL